MDAIAPQDTVGSQSGAALYRKIAWRIMPLLMLCYVAAYLTGSTSASPSCR